MNPPLGACHPTKLDEPGTQRRAEKAGEVGSLLGPVDAVAHQWPAPRRIEADAQLGEPSPASRGHLEAHRPSCPEHRVTYRPIVGLDTEDLLADKRFAQGDAEASSEVVIAGTARSDRLGVGGLAK